MQKDKCPCSKLNLSFIMQRDNVVKLLLFDLDGTLLKTDKTISERTLSALRDCKNKGYLIGISTSRSEQNCLAFLGELSPDILITSGGALIKKDEQYIFSAVFSSLRTKEIISLAREVCGNDVEITVDTIDSHYWNYKIDPQEVDKNWGESIWSDYSDFSEEALKICVEIFDDDTAKKIVSNLTDCDVIRFSDGYWYKFTRKNVTKENAISVMCEKCDIPVNDITSFGDDLADIGMLKMTGTGIAMGNALDEVKEIADIVIGSNDNDGIAEYIEKNIL